MQGRVPQVAPLVDDLLHGRGQPLVRRVQQEIQAALEPVRIIYGKKHYLIKRTLLVV